MGKTPADMQPELVLTDAPSPEARRAIDDGLTEYNLEQVSAWGVTPLACLVRDPDGTVLGGMLGRTSIGLLFIDVVFLPSTLRRGGIGTRMLGMMETEAIRRGCRTGVLFTISFQAPAFYARHGWREFGRVACDPPGTARVFMTKEF
jgi:GNAT superfamily N-acetyltransferase